MKIKKNVSDVFYTLKGIAIITVVYAHCIFETVFLKNMSSLIGLIGVPCFLVVSGLFFDVNASWGAFFKKVGKRLIIPWLLYGSVTYLLYLFSTRDSFAVIELIKWIVGYKTWLYYVPLLISCMIITKFFYRNKYFIPISLFINLLSVLGSQLEVLTYSSITIYQNVFNWIGFFSLGIYLRGKGILEHVPTNVKQYKKNLVYCGICGIIMGLIVIVLNQFIRQEITYFNVISVIYELCMVAFLYLLSFLLNSSKILVFIGKNSYPIFFLHMQIGMNLFEILEELLGLNEMICFVIKPLSVVLILSFGIFIFIKFCEKMRMDKFLDLIAFAK